MIFYVNDTYPSSIPTVLRPKAPTLYSPEKKKSG